MFETIDRTLAAMDQYGAAAVIVVALLLANGFFIVRDWRREEKQRQQISENHQYTLGVLIPLVTECKEAVCQSSAVLVSCKEVIAQNSEIMKELAHGRGQP